MPADDPSRQAGPAWLVAEWLATEERLFHVKHLFAMDEALRAEADRMLADSGFGPILGELGFVAVGSYPMRTMTWRDLDFERTQDPPDWADHWDLGTRLAKTGWCWRLTCIDAYRPASGEEGGGLYWGLRAANPAGGETWKLDLWTAREFGHAKREKWMSLLTEEKRAQILAIKEVVCHEPEYRRTLLSVHIYDAVLEHGIEGLEQFREWWLIHAVKPWNPTGWH